MVPAVVGVARHSEHTHARTHSHSLPHNPTDERTDVLTARMASVHTALGLRELTLPQLRLVLSLAVSDFDQRGLWVMMEAFGEREHEY